MACAPNPPLISTSPFFEKQNTKFRIAMAQENPRRRVIIGHDVWIGSTEDTNGDPDLLFSNDMGFVFIEAAELSANDVRELYLATCGEHNECIR